MTDCGYSPDLLSCNSDQPKTVKMSKEKALTNCVWKLKRYGRFLPNVKNNGGQSSWKVFESNECTGILELMILESGHFLVARAQELLEGFSLLNAQSFLKIQQKSDSLLFHMTLQGESRMIRVQFDGCSRSEAGHLCQKAVERLQEYLPVGTQEQPLPPLASHSQQEQNPVKTPKAISTVAQESLSIKHLSQGRYPVQSSLTNAAERMIFALNSYFVVEGILMSVDMTYFLGERGLSLPLAYRQATLPPGDVEALLRLCLLDSGFPAFVEEVENTLTSLSKD